jgi:hypothetical protein
MKILVVTTMFLQFACKEKTETAEAPATTSTPSELMKNPVNALSTAVDVLASAGALIGSGYGAALTEDVGSWTPQTHCMPSSGMPAGQEGIDQEELIFQGRLNRQHPRAAFQHFYCMMQLDEGNSTTFLGTISSLKLYACLIDTDGLNFTAVPTTTNVDTDTVRECWEDALDLDDAEMDEMLESGKTLSLTVTSAFPAAFGGDGWDASIFFEGLLEEKNQKIELLVKDSDDKFGVAVISNSGHPVQADAVRVGLDKSTGEIWYEAKAQRLRVSGQGSDVNWNKSSVGYVKGEIDEDYSFSKVDKFFGFYSDLSKEQGGHVAEDIARGEIWTVNGGTPAEGVVTNSYDLACVDDVCRDPNLIASWEATSEAATATCNGVSGTEDNTCTVTGIEVTEDAHTALIMHPDHEAYKTTEVWFAKVTFPAFSSLKLDFSQD